MSIKIAIPKPCVNHLGDIHQPPIQSHSFGKLSFPKKFQSFSSKKTPFLASSAATEVAEVEKITSFTPDLGDLWREIQGSNNWDNLINPLHPLLRQEIIRYGEFVTACYKAFDLDPNSKRFLSCKYGKHSMLKQVGMENSGYEITKYIYATPDINIPIQNGSSCGRWIGYVAVSSDNMVKKLGRRDIVITFRGTVTYHEWVANFMSSLTPARLDPNNPRPDVKVESGFLSLYTCDESDNKFGIESCRQQLLSEVSRLSSLYKGEEVSISIAGHSMGSSLALLLAYDISELGLNRVKSPRGGEVMVAPVTVFSFGGPRVGNGGFKERCEELGVRVLRITNVNDPITKLPGVFMNENLRVLGGRFEFPWSCSCYAHVGVELVLDFFNMQNPSCVHDLEAYIGSVLMKNRSSGCSSPRLTLPGDSISPEISIDGDGDRDRDGDRDYLGRFKEALNMGAQNLNILPLGIAFTNVLNFLHSQRSTDILFDENIYILMNNLALYVLL
ncbi:galactolipase DONGLE, chloroplastic [Euphorbia lathyris]|uniref:galactolipase DONGLE, chloroplastic n=1 Tax=Euphorbia lathyris TaxID=212925 RepID=UPI003313C4FF